MGKKIQKKSTENKENNENDCLCYNCNFFQIKSWKKNNNKKKQIKKQNKEQQKKRQKQKQKIVLISFSEVKTSK